MLWGQEWKGWEWAAGHEGFQDNVSGNHSVLFLPSGIYTRTLTVLRSPVVKDWFKLEFPSHFNHWICFVLSFFPPYFHALAGAVHTAQFGKCWKVGLSELSTPFQERQTFMTQFLISLASSSISFFLSLLSRPTEWLEVPKIYDTLVMIWDGSWERTQL